MTSRMRSPPRLVRTICRSVTSRTAVGIPSGSTQPTTQPTVSKLIASLESALGVRLLERGPARVVLTEEGTRFLDSAKRLLEDYDEAVAALDERTRQPRGLVRVSAPVALGELKLNA